VQASATLLVSGTVVHNIVTDTYVAVLLELLTALLEYIPLQIYEYFFAVRSMSDLNIYLL